MTAASGPLRAGGRPFIVAHRGASEDAPENTLPAFDLAIRSGAEVVECDVHLSRDGEVVVIHDADLGRTTAGRGAVAELSWRELRTVEAGYPARFGTRYAGTRLPRLADLLEMARCRCEVMIEIKADAVGAAAGGIEERCVAAVTEAGMTGHVAYISMSPSVVSRIRALDPDAVTGLVFRRRRLWRLVPEAIRVRANLLIHATTVLLARPGVVREARAAGLRTGAYVVNDESTLHRLLAAGVESLASDRPVAMRAALARQRPLVGAGGRP